MKLSTILFTAAVGFAIASFWWASAGAAAGILVLFALFEEQSETLKEISKSNERMLYVLTVNHGLEHGKLCTVVENKVGPVNE